MTIIVYPGATNPTHDFSLSDGVQTWGLRLDGGPEALHEEPLTPSTLRFGGGASAFGAWEPGMVQIEQRDWSGGRGAQRFSADDAESSRRFFDSQNAWTLTPGMLLPAPQWRPARGLRNAVQHLPGSVQWKSIFAEQRFISARFTIGATDLSPAAARVWLRRIGSPGALALGIYEDEDSKPAAAIADANDLVTIADMPDTISRFYSFDLSAFSGSLQAGIDYHLVLTASPADNAANHWEIGVEKKYAGGHLSADGTIWTPTRFCAYSRVEDASIARSFMFFQFAGAFYAVDQRADGSPSHLYLNGDRGLATSATAASLEDADKAWAADQWAGAWVRIVKGKGAGQARQILSNSAIELVVTAWDQTPDATSEYVIYSTDLWHDISPTSGDLIDGVVSHVALMDDQVLLAQGASVPILRMRFNLALAVPAHEFDDDGANVADRLHVFHHSTAGPQVYRALSVTSEVSRATPTAWGTALAFGAAIKVGDKSAALCELFDHGGQLWALKTNGAWTIDEADKAHESSLQLPTLPDSATRLPVAQLEGDLLIASGHRLLEVNGSVVSDIGPNGEVGLPANRQGSIRALQLLSAAHLVAAIDAGAGESSVMSYMQGSCHELTRAPEAGQRIQALGLQDCPGTRPRLWIDVAGDLTYIDLPRDSDSPLSDDGLAYQHEAVVISGTVDMGAALLPKFIKQLSLWSANLGRSAHAVLDFQTDEEIGTANWQSAGALYSSPLDSLPLFAGPLHAIRTRIRLLTSECTRPPIVHSAVLEGFARTPLKYQWTLRVRLADLQADGAGGIDPSPDAFMSWLQDAARSARRVTLRSIWPALDSKTVLVEPPSLKREYIDGTQWGGSATVILREG
jgi:hypothetical protein